jgi:hypothetical protein
MPRDYKNAVVYKLAHRDPSHTDCYVGSTCRLRKRRFDHKESCTNERSPKYNQRVYQHIRENGGWENWEVVPVEVYPCSSHLELLVRERHWVETLGATLNSQVPAKYAASGSYENYHKQYYQEHRREAAEAAKARYAEKREEILSKCRQYREENRGAIAARRAEKLTCECGALVSLRNITRHRKEAKKHARYVASLTETNLPTSQ